MNFLELERYITDLKQSGFEHGQAAGAASTGSSAVPLFALIMAMIAVPFGFLVGNRGAMTGIGVSIGIAMAYLGVGQLFEKIGDVGQLPPAMAAWSPDVVFALAGAVPAAADAELESPLWFEVVPEWDIMTESCPHRRPSNKERICAIRIILRRTGKSTRLAVW